VEHKVIITDDESTINDWLSRGWEIVSVTPQYVATTYLATTEQGKFCFVIQKSKS
jgi:hypothetical protein